MRLNSILKNVEKLTRLDAIYFARGSIFGLLQHLIGLLSGLVVSFIFGHFVSREIFGQYSLVLSILSLLTFISLPGIDAVLTLSIAKGYESSLLSAFKTRFLSSLLGIPLLIIFTLYYVTSNQQWTVNALLLSIPFFPLLYSFQSYQAVFIAKQRFERIAFYASLSSIVLAMLTVFTGILRPSATFFILVYLLSTILPAIVGFLEAKNISLGKKGDDPELVPYGIFLSLNGALAWIAGNLGGIILASFLGVSELAIFAAASKLPAALQKGYSTISKTITAKIAAQSTFGQKEIITHHWWKLVLLGLVFFLPMWILGPIVIHFLFPHGYEEAITYVRWLSLLFIPLPLTWALSDLIIFQKQKKAQLIINTIPASVKLLAYFIVIPIWHTPGLVFITVAEDYFILLLYLLVFTSWI